MPLLECQRESQKVVLEITISSFTLRIVFSFRRLMDPKCDAEQDAYLSFQIKEKG
jgi:hypothetical protein